MRIPNWLDKSCINWTISDSLASSLSVWKKVIDATKRPSHNIGKENPLFRPAFSAQFLRGKLALRKKFFIWFDKAFPLNVLSESDSSLVNSRVDEIDRKSRKE